MAFVEIRNLSRNYGDFALSNISLEIEKGQILTLMGESGSGKTSILRNVSGLDFPDSGKILIDGKEVTGVQTGMRNIGMIFQDLALFPHMNAYDNIAYGMRAKRIRESSIKQTVSEISETLRIADLLVKFPSEISGGEKQRVAMARSLVMSPDLLLMDEPMSSLDPGLRNDIMLEIKSLSSKLGQTIIYVTHDVREGLFLGNSAAFIRAGIVIKKGSPEEMWEQPDDEGLAKFLGYNILKTGNRKIAVRPEDIEISEGEGEILGRIIGYGFEGNWYRVNLEIDDSGVVDIFVKEVPDYLLQGKNEKVRLKINNYRTLK
ncbi:MAG: ABC transporter ATP-binding protein [Thermoplasmataceae archaeon]